MPDKVIIATWTVTHAGVVLLSSADEDDMEAEPTISRQAEVDVRKPIGASFAKPKGRANALHVLSFSRVKYHATDVIARAWLLTHAALLSGVEGNATIALLEGGTLTLANAVLTSFQSRSEHSTTFTSYQLTGGAIT
jgi:hypothetical protein